QPADAGLAHHEMRNFLDFAGGIGITPFLSHMAELQHSDVDWQLHYCSRNPESCAFRDELVQHPQAEGISANRLLGVE
ncbi:hypothetical protein ACUOFC_65510, partial [Escherichia sp. TWPC-MK]